MRRAGAPHTRARAAPARAKLQDALAADRATKNAARRQSLRELGPRRALPHPQIPLWCPLGGLDGERRAIYVYSTAARPQSSSKSMSSSSAKVAEGSWLSALAPRAALVSTPGCPACSGVSQPSDATIARRSQQWRDAAIQ